MHITHSARGWHRVNTQQVMVTDVTAIILEVLECPATVGLLHRPRRAMGTTGSGSSRHILKGGGEHSGPELQSQEQWRKTLSQEEQLTLIIAGWRENSVSCQIASSPKLKVYK